MALVVTYLNELGLPPATGDFQIFVDGAPIARFEPNAVPDGYYDARYAIPANLVRKKTTVTVRFQAGRSGCIAPVYGVRTIRT
jgi:hypothetical protein